ncbi:hypothetical protein FPQ18DRAFT_236843, partial [Pyronema domesticum]
AEIYCKICRWKEAEILISTAIQILEEENSTHDSDYFNATDLLVSVYLGQGRHDDAVRLHTSLVDIRRFVHGSGHPDTLKSLDGLVSMYQEQGRLIDAGFIALEALEARMRLLQPTDLNSVWSLIR